MTTQLAIRLPEDLLRQLDALVPSTHANRSEADDLTYFVYQKVPNREVAKRLSSLDNANYRRLQHSLL